MNMTNAIPIEVAQDSRLSTNSKGLLTELFLMEYSGEKINRKLVEESTSLSSLRFSQAWLELIKTEWLLKIPRYRYTEWKINQTFYEQ